MNPPVCSIKNEQRKTDLGQIFYSLQLLYFIDHEKASRFPHICRYFPSTFEYAFIDIGDDYSIYQHLPSQPELLLPA